MEHWFIRTVRYPMRQKDRPLLFKAITSQFSFLVKITIKQNTFLPPGWDYDRVMNGTIEGFTTLTEDQQMALFNGRKEAGLCQAVKDKNHARSSEK